MNVFDKRPISRADLGCVDKENHALIGYNSLRIFSSDNKVWGGDILDDTNLALKIQCTASKSSNFYSHIPKTLQLKN